MNLKRLRLFLWVAVGIAALAGLWIALRAPSPQIDRASSELPLAIGGPFTLVGSDGKPFSSTQLSGRPFAIFFGFTNCPDVCPTRWHGWPSCAGSSARATTAFEIVFVSVDPERDGPAEVGAIPTCSEPR